MKRFWRGLLVAVSVIALGVSTVDCGGDNSTTSNEGSDAITDNVDGESEVITVKYSQAPMEIQKTVNLNVYYPNFSRIELVGSATSPSQDDKTIVWTSAAAFTKDYLEEFKQENIVGRHVSGGHYYDGPVNKRATGAFVWAPDGTLEFVYKDEGKSLKSVSEKGGTGFEQEMMIHADTIVPHVRPDDNVNFFRALCLVDGRLAIVDSNKPMQFGDFINSLKHLGASEAIYMDMGGWSYAWYRDEEGKVHELNGKPTPYATNWLTFYR